MKNKVCPNCTVTNTEYAQECANCKASLVSVKAEEVPTKDAGSIGGLMVKKMIQSAERSMFGR